MIDISIIETIVEEQLDELTALADQNFVLGVKRRRLILIAS